MSPYEEYIRSDHWLELRLKAKAKAGGKCESCSGNGRLEGHHLQYRNLTDCTEEDIVCLCLECHCRWHQHHSSSIVKSRDYVLGFLAAIRTIVKDPAYRPPRTTKIKSPPRTHKSIVLNDPEVINAAKTLELGPFKRWLRKHFTNQKAKGAKCSWAIRAYQSLRIQYTGSSQKV